jgi:hypothetical protein
LQHANTVKKKHCSVEKEMGHTTTLRRIFWAPNLSKAGFLLSSFNGYSSWSRQRVVSPSAAAQKANMK